MSTDKKESIGDEGDEEDQNLDELDRNCGRCGCVFASTPLRQRPTFVPLFCGPCERVHAEFLRANDPLYGQVKADWQAVFAKDGTIRGTLVSKAKPDVAHARYSPSTYGAREKCAGWTPDRDPSKDTSAADRGTLIHKAVENEDSSKLLDQRDRDCAESCLRFVEGLADSIEGHERFRELTVPVLDQFGIVDDLIVAGDTGEMTDYKTGWRPVPDAEINAQVQGYALGVFDKFPLLQTLNVHLLMPRQGQISDATYTRKDHYQTLKQRTFKVIEASKAVDQLFEESNTDKLLTILQPSAENCEFCGRKAECPALFSMALTVVKRYDETALLPDIIHGSQITDPNMMALAYQIAPIMEKWAGGVKKAALAMRMEQGIEIPGYDLAERSGTRKISNSQAAWEIAEHHGVSPEQFAECADVSLPLLEKAVAAKAPRGSKGTAKQTLENQLRDRSAITDAGKVYYLKKT